MRENRQFQCNILIYYILINVCLRIVELMIIMLLLRLSLCLREKIGAIVSCICYTYMSLFHTFPVLAFFLCCERNEFNGYHIKPVIYALFCVQKPERFQILYAASELAILFNSYFLCFVVIVYIHRCCLLLLYVLMMHGACIAGSGPAQWH